MNNDKNKTSVLKMTGLATIGGLLLAGIVGMVQVQPDKAILKAINADVSCAERSGFAEIIDLDETEAPVTAPVETGITAVKSADVTTTSELDEEKEGTHTTKTLPYFNKDNVTESSGIDYDTLSWYLSEKLPEMKYCADEIYKADREGLNAIYIIAVARCETGGGKVLAASFNLFNVFDDECAGCKNYVSYAQSVKDFVFLMKSSYLSKYGMWYEGTGLRDIEKHYCLTIEEIDGASEIWSTFVGDLMDEIVTQIESRD